MGERAAYKATYNGKSLFMIRKQWYLGSSHEDLKKIVYNVAGNLMKDVAGIGQAKIGDGFVALRDDLGIGRLSMALLTAVSSPPFDEVVEDGNINCDINDHGIFEIEMITWDHWRINHYPVKYGDRKTWTSILGEKELLADVTFQKGKSLKTGMKINFLVPDNWEYGEA